MQLTIVHGENLVTVQVDENMSLETLKAILEAETNIPAGRQFLLLGTNPLRDNNAVLSACGINDGDVLQ
ncbi:hypothetical protein DUNSADRAFT_17845, partial [Dunaliella salina]